MASHNPGYITGSTVKAILTGKGENMLVGGVNFCHTIAKERSNLAELVDEFEGNTHTEWGNEWEAFAIKRYNEWADEKEFTIIHSEQEPKVKGYLSCTVDGLVNKNGVLEIKCPSSSNKHEERFEEKGLISFVKDHYDQCMFNCMMWEREFTDLVSYDVRWKRPLDLIVIRLSLDKAWVDRFNVRYNEAEQVIKERLELLKSIKEPIFKTDIKLK